MSNGIHYAVSERVATIIIDRPETRNSLAPEVVAELTLLLRDADREPEVKCILIRATGENFTVGGDIKGFKELLGQSSDERHDTFERKMLVGNRFPAAMLEVAKPIVIATRGSVAGAGVAMCLAADFVIASESSFFVLSHVKIGLSLDCGLSGLLSPAMGIKQAKRLALLGERIGAEEARSLDIVTTVVADGALEEESAALARKLSNGPGTAMGITKALLNRAAHSAFTEQLAYEAKGVARCAATDDFGRGIESILARQAPKFD